MDKQGYISVSVAIQENILKNGKTSLFPKRLTAANVDVVGKIHNMIKLVNLPTQREMASKCRISLGTINQIISKYLKAQKKVPSSSFNRDPNP